LETGDGFGYTTSCQYELGKIHKAFISMDGASSWGSVKGQLSTMNFSTKQCVAFARLTLTPGEAELVSAKLLDVEEQIGVVAQGLPGLNAIHGLVDTTRETAQETSEVLEFPTPVVLMPTYGLELPQVG